MQHHAPRLAALLVAAALAAAGPAHAAVRGGTPTPGPDHLTGTAGPDSIDALAGNDVVHSLGGADLVFGGPGADVVRGGRGADELRGGGGDDLLDAGSDHARDVGVGGFGNDRIYVRGTDLAFGGAGADRIWATYAVAGAEVRCGPGEDRLVFNQPSPDVVRRGCEHVRVRPAG